MNKNIKLKVLSNFIYLLSIFLFSYLGRSFKDITNNYSNEIIIIASLILTIIGKLFFIREFDLYYLIFHIKRKKYNTYSNVSVLIFNLMYFFSTLIFMKYYVLLSAVKVGILKNIKIIVVFLFSYLFLNKRINYKQMIGVFLVMIGVVGNSFNKSNKKTITNELINTFILLFSLILSACDYCYFDLKLRPRIFNYSEYFADMNLFYFIVALSFQILCYLREKNIKIKIFINYKVIFMGTIGVFNVLASQLNGVWYSASDRLMIRMFLTIISDIVSDICLKNEITKFMILFYFITVLGILIYKKVLFT